MPGLNKSLLQAFFSIIVMTAALLMLPVQLRAQAANARLGGTISDSSGAALAGARVICRNVQTGLTIEATTNSEGIYQFTELPVGQYELSATQTGFQKLVRAGITLITGQVVELNLQMQVGAVESTIEVTGEIPVVQTTSATVQTSMTVRQVQELPLNGRNPLQLVALTAGATVSDAGTIGSQGQQDNRGIAVNGLRPTQNNWRLDGSNYNNRFFGSAPVLPNPDTMEEFTVQSANYSARTSGAGAAIEMTTRSGTNQFHGSAFEFLRNTVLNANDFFLNSRSLKRPPFKRNQYGATFGGPVMKDKLFFFFAFQGTRQRSSLTSFTIQSITAAQRDGDFSALTTPIKDPVTGQNFTGNKIPSTRLDPVMRKVLDAYLPLPNSGNNLIVVPNRNIDDDQYTGKVDWQITQNNRLSGRYFDDDNFFQRVFTAPPGFFASNFFRNRSVTIRDTHVFTPTLTATFSGAWSRFRRVQEPQAPGLKTIQSFGVKVPQSIQTSFFPGVRIMANPAFQLFSGGGLEQTPTTEDFHAAAIWIKGRHTLQFGSDLQFDQLFTLDASFTPATWFFNGSRTGNILADVLMGLPFRFQQDSGRTNKLRESKYHFYLQDDWKVNQRLTLNLGLRWEPKLHPIDKLNNLVGFVPGQQSTIAPGAPLGLVYPGDAGVDETVFPHDYNNWAPRIGFALDVFGNGRTVVRSGYGIFYVEPALTLYTRTVSTQPSVVTIDQQFAANVLATFVDPYASIAGGNPFPRNRISPSEFKNFKYLLPVSGGVLDPHSRTGYSQNWNLTIEQQLFRDVSVSAAYVGNLGVHILAGRQLNEAINNTRIFAGLGAMEIATDYESSNFHSFQLNVTKRTSRGLTLLGTYVWSKNIDNSSATVEGDGFHPRSSLNERIDRGLSDYDVTHKTNLSFVYDLPKFERGGSLVKAILNNWQLNGIFTAQSGLPFTARSGTNRSGALINQDNADQLTASPSIGNNGDKVQYLAPLSAGQFAAAAAGTFGTAGRNSLRGPGYVSLDLAVFKNIPVTEQVKIQFRAEGFNVANRVNFNNPNATITAGANFGRIQSALDPRVFQFGLKVLF